jgi:hypothetical protein
MRFVAHNQISDHDVCTLVVMGSMHSWHGCVCSSHISNDPSRTFGGYHNSIAIDKDIGSSPRTRPFENYS